MNAADAPAGRRRGARCASRSREGLTHGQRAARPRWRAALLPQAARRDGAALPDRRLHRLLRRHPPRHRGRQAVPARHTRCCRTTSGCRSATTAAPRRCSASGHAFPRPCGQLQGPTTRRRRLAPTQRLDYELELGIFIGRPNALGEPIADRARPRTHVFGLTLFNDWSARDIQAWEYQPLGPVPVEELRQHDLAVDRDAGGAGAVPPRRSCARPDDPQPLPYLDCAGQPRARRLRHRARGLAADRARCARPGSAGERISRSNFADAAYWTVAQLVTHHTVNGCSLRSRRPVRLGHAVRADARAGRLAAGADRGRQASRSLWPTASSARSCSTATRSSLRGHCQRDGFRRIGFGDCTATVLPPVPSTKECS